MTTRYRMNRLPQQARSQQPQASRCFKHLLLLALCVLPACADDPLQIIQAGIQRAEDGPLVSSQFRFLPGDYVYAQFQVSGYAVEADVNKLSLAYEITPQDGKGIALTPPVTGAIQDTLSAEDKNWTPKRRISFLLPSFVGAGEFRLHFAVKDLISKTGTELNLPLRLGGVTVVPSGSVSVQAFQFLRNEDDTEPLEVAAYAPGDTVFARFHMSGFKLGPENRYQLSYGISVTRPDGKPFVNEPNAAKLSESSFYPAQYVPGNIEVTTPKNAARGQYVVLLTVHDLTGAQTAELRRAFSIE